jgi:hypothetical protein
VVHHAVQRPDFRVVSHQHQKIEALVQSFQHIKGTRITPYERHSRVAEAFEGYPLTPGVRVADTYLTYLIIVL